MKDAIVHLIGPERFEWSLVAPGTGLLIVIVLAMLWGMGTRWPFIPGSTGKERERERAPATPDIPDAPAD
jgi:hypothetical protein